MVRRLRQSHGRAPSACPRAGHCPAARTAPRSCAPHADWEALRAGGGVAPMLGHTPPPPPNQGCFQESCWGCVGLRRAMFGCADAERFPRAEDQLVPPPLPALSCCSSSPPLPSTLSVSFSPTAQLPATKPSGCKTFWKRCQGLLGNTWGSLKRKRKPPRQPVEEVTSPGEAACRAEWLHGVNPPGRAAVPCHPWSSGRGETLPVPWALQSVGAGACDEGARMWLAAVWPPPRPG